MTPSRQERHCSTSSSSSPSSPTVGEISVREREDAPNSDMSPVPMSKLVDDGSGQPDETQETKIERGNLSDSEIPEWLQEFRENLVDEIPLQGGSDASSSHEVSLEPTTKRREDLGKHSVLNHFHKDRNCEICKRTKITRALCRRRNGEAVPRAVNFGDLITADHKVLSDNCESRKNHRYGVVVQDLATQCYTYLRNVTDSLSDGKTPSERRFGQTFKEPIIPLGSLVEYHPFTAKDRSRIHQFGKKVLPGLFLGYGSVRGWNLEG